MEESVEESSKVIRHSKVMKHSESAGAAAAEPVGDRKEGGPSAA